jgi:hypothetical protein
MIRCSFPFLCSTLRQAQGCFLLETKNPAFHAVLFVFNPSPETSGSGLILNSDTHISSLRNRHACSLHLFFPSPFSALRAQCTPTAPAERSSLQGLCLFLYLKHLRGFVFFASLCEVLRLTYSLLFAYNTFVAFLLRSTSFEGQVYYFVLPQLLRQLTDSQDKCVRSYVSRILFFLPITSLCLCVLCAFV